MSIGPITNHLQKNVQLWKLYSVVFIIYNFPTFLQRHDWRLLIQFSASVLNVPQWFRSVHVSRAAERLCVRSTSASPQGPRDWFFHIYSGHSWPETHFTVLAIEREKSTFICYYFKPWVVNISRVYKQKQHPSSKTKKPSSSLFMHLHLWPHNNWKTWLNVYRL